MAGSDGSKYFRIDRRKIELSTTLFDVSTVDAFFILFMNQIMRNPQ